MNRRRDAMRATGDMHTAEAIRIPLPHMSLCAYPHAANHTLRFLMFSMINIRFLNARNDATLALSGNGICCTSRLRFEIRNAPKLASNAKMPFPFTVPHNRCLEGH